MRTRAAVLFIALLLTACGQEPSAATSEASSSPTAVASPTRTRTPSAAPTPTTAGAAVSVSCLRKPAPADPLVLALAGGTETRLAVLDVIDPLHPFAACDIDPAGGGRFLADGSVAFWTRGHQPRLGLADLVAHSARLTQQVAHPIDSGAFSPDGSAFAYRSTDAAGTTTLYLLQAGTETALFSRPPVGGHGGPVGGPFSELGFSPDGQHLLVFDLFIAPGDPGPPLRVFNRSGGVELQGSYSMGFWQPG